MESGPLAMIAVCLSFVALNEAEQVSLKLYVAMVKVRPGSYRRKDVLNLDRRLFRWPRREGAFDGTAALH